MENKFFDLNALVKRASIFQMQKAFTEMLFKANQIPDITGDGLIDRSDLRAFVEPMININSRVQVERLIREVQISTDTDITFADAVDELFDEERQIRGDLRSSLDF